MKSCSCPATAKAATSTGRHAGHALHCRRMRHPTRRHRGTGMMLWDQRFRKCLEHFQSENAPRPHDVPCAACIAVDARKPFRLTAAIRRIVAVAVCRLLRAAATAPIKLMLLKLVSLAHGTVLLSGSVMRALRANGCEDSGRCRHSGAKLRRLGKKAVFPEYF